MDVNTFIITLIPPSQYTITRTMNINYTIALKYNNNTTYIITKSITFIITIAFEIDIVFIVLNWYLFYRKDKR